MLRSGEYLRPVRQARLRAREALLVADSLGPGGSEKQIFLLSKHMQPPWLCTVFSLEAGMYYDLLLANDIEVIVSQRRFRYDFAHPLFHILRVVKGSNPDLLHSWGWMSSAICTAASILSNVPHISSIRTGALHTRRKWFERFFVRMADHVIANSRAGIRAWGISFRKASLVRNGVSRTIIDIGLNRRYATTKRYSIVMIANTHSDKDYDTFIESAKRISASLGRDCVKFTGLGSGPDLERLRAESIRLASGIDLQFPGYIADLSEIISSADLGFLLSNRGEGCSNALLEMMAAGLPVIATDLGGNSEIIDHGRNGFLVPRGDAGRIASIARCVIEDSKLRARIGREALNTIIHNYTIPKMVNRTAEVYEYVTTKANT